MAGQRGIEAGAVVSHLDVEVFVGTRQANPNLAAGGRVFERVVDQVADHGHQVVAVGEQHAVFAIHLQDQCDAGAGGGRLVAGHDVAQQQAQIDASQARAQLPGFRLHQPHQLFDQTAEPVELVQREVQALAFGIGQGGGFFLQLAQGKRDQHHRCAQFVADIGQHARAEAIHRFQPLCLFGQLLVAILDLGMGLCQLGMGLGEVGEGHFDAVFLGAQFGGALVDLLIQLRRTQPQVAHAQADDGQRQQNAGDEQGQAETRRFIPAVRDAELQARGCVAPDAVAVAGQDFEAIVARWQIAETDAAVIGRIGPAFFQRRETMAEAQFVAGVQIGSAVTDKEIAHADGQGHAIAHGMRLTAAFHAVDHNVRRMFAQGHRVRIDPDHAALRGKPELSVVIHHGRWLYAAIAFQFGEAVGQAQHQG